jgi:NAD(P)-dependent dehydrogenase (short-subunit alcohol dehydrogenase family)
MTANVNDGPKTDYAPTSFTVSIAEGFWRSLFKWVSGILLVVVVGALLVSINIFQLTSPGPAAATLERALASLTEIDALLLEGEEDLRASAEQSPEDESRLEHYPIDVAVSGAEVQRLSGGELRELILSRSADKFYARGLSSFEERGSESSDISLLSAPGAVRYSVGLLTEDTHDIARVIAASLLGAALLLTLLLLLLSRGYGRLTGLGIILMAAALPYLLAAVGIRFVLKLASESEGDYLTAQLYTLGKDVAWLPIHTGIAVVLLGVTFAMAGVAFGWLQSRRDEARLAELREAAG